MTLKIKVDGWNEENVKNCNFVYCEDSKVRSIVRWQKAGRAKKVQVKIAPVKVVPSVSNT